MRLTVSVFSAPGSNAGCFVLSGSQRSRRVLHWSLVDSNILHTGLHRSIVSVYNSVPLSYLSRIQACDVFAP